MRVHAGKDPVSGRRHDLVEIVPAGPKAAAQAEAVRTRLLNQLDERRHPRTSATVDQLLDWHFEMATLAPTTLATYLGYATKHIRPLIGQLQVGALDADAHRADQAAEEPHREITEADVVDDDHTRATEPVVETSVRDLRDESTTDATEHADPDRGHVLTSHEATVAVARAQTALAEIAARRAADEQREAEEAEQERRDELARWAEYDPAELDATSDDTAEDADERD